MNEMTLPSGHRIQNSRLNMLPLGHRGSPQYCVLREDREETFLFFFQTAEFGSRTPSSSVKGSGANHHPRAPAHKQRLPNEIDVQLVLI